MSDVIKLAKKLKEAADAYYNGDPIMSDVEFDTGFARLKELDPENPMIKEIGAPIQISKWAKVQHEVVHGSQHKVQTKEELKEWIKDKKGPFVIQEKLDGITMVLKFDNKLISAATRGDGIIGEELLENVQHCDGVKTAIREFAGTVRGELLLPTSKFIKYFKPEGYRNERNSLGVVRSDDLDKIKHFKFIPYDIVATGFKTEQEMNNKLTQMFGYAVFSKIVKDYDEIVAVYDEYIANKRANIDHAIDGLIIRINDMDAQQALGHTSDRPNGQIAFKFPPKVAKTKLLDIEWGMGISGRLGATAILEPIELDGITIKRCNLNNIDWIKMMDIGIGDEVLIGRSNDVIPTLLGVTNRDNRKFWCPKCQKIVEHNHLTCKLNQGKSKD